MRFRVRFTCSFTQVSVTFLRIFAPAGTGFSSGHECLGNVSSQHSGRAKLTRNERRKYIFRRMSAMRAMRPRQGLDNGKAKKRTPSTEWLVFEARSPCRNPGGRSRKGGDGGSFLHLNLGRILDRNLLTGAAERASSTFAGVFRQRQGPTAAIRSVPPHCGGSDLLKEKRCSRASQASAQRLPAAVSTRITAANAGLGAPWRLKSRG